MSCRPELLVHTFCHYHPGLLFPKHLQGAYVGKTFSWQVANLEFQGFVLLNPLPKVKHQGWPYFWSTFNGSEIRLTSWYVENFVEIVGQTHQHLPTLTGAGTFAPIGIHGSNGIRKMPGYHVQDALNTIKSNWWYFVQLLQDKTWIWYEHMNTRKWITVPLTNWLTVDLTDSWKQLKQSATFLAHQRRASFHLEPDI